MTQEFIKSFDKVWTANKEKQEALTKVLNTTLSALCKDVLTAVTAKSILGEERTPERARFLEVFSFCMPHYMLNGTDKAIACDFVAATDSNRLSKTIKQYRLSVDSDIVKPEGCATYIKTTSEEPKMQEFTLKYDSGFEEVIKRQVRNAEGEVETEQVTVELVPRKKSAWGYTKDVKQAILNAMAIIEEA